MLSLLRKTPNYSMLLLHEKDNSFYVRHLSKIHSGNVSRNSSSHSIMINGDGVADIEDRDEGLTSANLIEKRRWTCI